MKSFFIFWVIGCVLMGIVAKNSIHYCPNDRLLAADMLAAVAIWPVPVVAAIGGAKGKRICDDGQPYRD